MKPLSTSAWRRITALLGRVGLASLGALAAQAHAEVRIAQVYASGGAAGSLYARDFVELYNSGAPQDLSGWTLQHASASGSTWSSAALPALVLAPGERLLVRFSGELALGAGQAPDLPAYDADHPASLAPAGGKLALCASAAPLTGAQPNSATIVDFLGWGSANWREPFVAGSALDNAPALNSAVALLRAECGARDVESNALDFQLAFPRPRGRTSNSSSGVDLGVFVTPRLARPLDSVLLVAAPLDCAAGAQSAPWVLSVDASALGLGAAVQLNDAGLFGDVLAGDGLYSRSFSLPAALAPGDLTLAVSASDGARASLARAALVVLPASVPGVDACASAEVVSGPFPLTRVGSLAAANSETNPLLHASSSVSTMGARRGHWLRVLGNGSTLSADTCLSAPLGLDAPDTVLLVATGSCGALSVVGFGDDQVSLCGAGFGPERRSRVDWCAAAGQEYFVWVAAFNSGSVPLNYELRISDLGPVCTPTVGGALCSPDLVDVDSFERESPLGPARNDVCLGANEPELLEAASPARVHRGHARAFGAHVDVDAYRVFAPVSELYRATLDAPFRARLELYQLGATGACPLGALLAASALSERCEPLELEHPLVAGGWYALVVRPQNSADPAWLGGFEPGGAASAYTLTTELGSAPPNDACGNAAQLACGATAAGTTWGARPEATGLLNACGGPGAGTSGAYTIEQPGVWYRVQAPSGADSALFVEIESAVFDSRLAVFSGLCNALVCVSANDDIDASGRSKVGWRAQAGVTYRVLVHGADEVRGPFTLSARCEPLADGDECAQPVEIDGFSGAALLSSLGATGANTSYPLGGAGGLTPCLVNGPSTSSYFDQWLSFDAPCDGLVQFETCGAFEAVLSVHADCPSTVDPFVLACSDAAPTACAPGARVSFATVAGATYWIRFAALDGAQDGGLATLSWSYADADADGTPDCADGCPNDPLKIAPGVCGCGVSDVDSDGDGVANCVDGCPNDPLKLAPGVCGCGVSDVDSDGDGVANCVDGCPTDPLKLAPGVCGCGVSDVDSDGDGVANCVDGCPNDPLKLAPGACGCGVSDVDSDGDGVANCIDACPNDPLKLAPGVCGCGVSDVDSDGDGVANCLDECPNDPLKLAPGVCGCGVSDVDSDGDGVANCLDECPNDPLKIAPGVCGCGVSDVDSDGDGVANCLDECPNDPLKLAPGVCGCGVSDVDSDGDGVANCIDECPNDPLKVVPGACGCGVSDVDSDGDGVANCLDECPNDPLKVVPGACGCGVSDVDSDGDGVANCLDECPNDPLKLAPGVCGCGVSEVDSDGDGAANCIDGCPNDPLKVARGVCGCGVSDVDSDGDGLANCIDNCAPIANPLQSDCDVDGVGDACEIGLGGEPDTNQNGVPDSCEFGALVSYCTSGTSTQGCVGAMGGVGVPSVSADRSFLLQATGVDGQRAGLIFYGVNGPANSPFASGLLCVKAPIQRSTALQSGGTAGVCNGRLTLDWTAFQASYVGLVGAPFQAGDLVWSQAWWRDPQAPSGARGSNALQFTLAP